MRNLTQRLERNSTAGNVTVNGNPSGEAARCEFPLVVHRPLPLVAVLCGSRMGEDVTSSTPPKRLVKILPEWQTARTQKCMGDLVIGIVTCPCEIPHSGSLPEGEGEIESLRSDQRERPKTNRAAARTKRPCR
ncbi:hypothetical protein CA54_30550 [Symmachiella macrocystis]|uniref:Uncharacterized protein n=1 Tax=Symmachiella macrocystis TaxID=2527985 RepID=A0A5C6BR64_9PLAN|nr:hypothetical protein CA54_30550 [Symmachiella macrocystis]